MTQQLDHATFSIASQSDIERTARQLALIRDQFLHTGDLGPCTLRPLILDSWQRCRTLRVDAARRLAQLSVASEDQLAQLRAANRALILAARPVLCRLTDFLADAGYVVALGDAHGRLLEVDGNAALRRRLARNDFLPGSNWSEAVAGTNAIGTALATGHVVQLMAAEHYCDGWQDITCTAAPIRHPLSGAVLGALDITGDYRLIRPFLSGYLAVAAMEVEQQLRAHLISNQPRTCARTIWMPGSPRAAGQDPVSPVSEAAQQEYAARAPAMHLPTPTGESPAHLPAHERRARAAERLAVASGMISASLDLATIIEQVAMQTAYVLELPYAAVGLFDQTGAVATLHAWTRRGHVPPERGRALERRIQQADEVALLYERGEPIIVDDPGDAPGLAAVTIALLPLATARGVIGFIAALRHPPACWSADEMRLGLALAAHAAAALENARLFGAMQQHNRHMEMLHTMGQFLRTLPDPGQHLVQVLECITGIMALDAGMILLIDQRTGTLTQSAHSGLPEAERIGGEQLLDLIRDLATRVASGGTSIPICTRDLTWGSLCGVLRAIGFCDLMAVPLTVSSTFLGVLIVGSRQHRELTEDDLSLFTTIGQQLGLALRNAQLLRSASEMEALREADRLKSEFLAAVSHDLRSPLTAIRASIESLLDQGSLQSPLQRERLLQHVAGQVGRLNRLVDQLLDLSRIRAGALRLDRDWTDLAVLMADVIAKFEHLNQGCVVQQDRPANLPLQYIDPDAIAQVLWNLLENAARYGPRHGPIHVQARWTGAEALISVADRGPGIPASEREKIFQHFYRLRRDQRTHARGSGLGLAICRGIVEAHGGRIWIEDHEGGGSVFRFVLPPQTDAISLEEMEDHELCTAHTHER